MHTLSFSSHSSISEASSSARLLLHLHVNTLHMSHASVSMSTPQNFVIYEGQIRGCKQPGSTYLTATVCGGLSRKIMAVPQGKHHLADVRHDSLTRCSMIHDGKYGRVVLRLPLNVTPAQYVYKCTYLRSMVVGLWQEYMYLEAEMTLFCVHVFSLGRCRCHAVLHYSKFPHHPASLSLERSLQFLFLGFRLPAQGPPLCSLSPVRSLVLSPLQRCPSPPQCLLGPLQMHNMIS